MIDSNTYRAMDALDQAAGLQAGEFTAEELLTAAIAEAEKHNPALNAIISPRYEAALNEAKNAQADASFLQRSPLAGLPFLIKDLSGFAGVAHSNGSQLFAGYQAETHSAIVQRFVDAGLFVLGKSNTPEFGLTLTTEPQALGACRNPWNLNYSTGGSSGGAAAAVAAGIIPAAHATDGGGSIRIPASCCGLFGLKPSRGLTVTESRLAECWSGMSVGHVVSRSVRDSAAYLDVLALDSPILFPVPSQPESFLGDVDTPPPVLRIAVQTSHPLGQELDGDCLRVIEQTAELCKELGHEVIELTSGEQPINYKPAVAAMNRLIALHTWQAVSKRLQQMGLDPVAGLDTAEMETSTRVMAQSGRHISADDYVGSLDTLVSVAADMAAFHEQYPVILSPVLNMPTAELGWLDMNSPDVAEYVGRFRAYSGFTALYNGTGQPSMSVPLFMDSRGLPCGSMFSAAWGQDSLLLRLARQLESARPWPKLAPSSD